jgi:NAD(P)-dependent dehydrogenase (short-subunit alcohol dehydrogenase family)
LVADVDVPGGEETVQRIKEAQGEATFLRTDVSRADDVETMVDSVVRVYGQLDCAFNNAGINLEVGPLSWTAGSLPETALSQAPRR